MNPNKKRASINRNFATFPVASDMVKKKEEEENAANRAAKRGEFPGVPDEPPKHLSTPTPIAALTHRG
jgi:hypothetical protein